MTKASSVVVNVT